MSEPEMKTDVEADEFTDELSDEALDREEGVRMSRVQYVCASSVLTGS